MLNHNLPVWRMIATETMENQQRKLFDDQPEPWELDDQPRAWIATLVFPTGPASEFDYLVPERLIGKVEAGRRVQAPLGRGNRPVIGYCVRLENRLPGQRRLKALEEVVDTQTLLSPTMIRLTQWIADYYLCDWAQVLEAVLPVGVRQRAGTRSVPLLSLVPDWIEKARQEKLSVKQKVVLKVLAEAKGPLTPTQLAQEAQCTTAPVTLLKKRGLIRQRMGRIQHTQPTEINLPRQPALVLNPSQRVALHAITATTDAREQRTILVHGVTGSGKTEVYIQAIEHVVRQGRQAIVLVPEISLTPQTVERFRSRFDHVAVLHSHLTDVERHWHWQQIASGRMQVVVGARSAIFAPTPVLGLIVLDEEHESSFKQESVPRYHARDVALARAEAERIPLVLGSATPSLESWHRAQTGQYQLVSMPHRVLDRPMPEVGTIDLRDQQYSARSRGAISFVLHRAMHTALEAGGQVILLLNRRGFATHIQCPACGNVLRCPNCDIALTHHRSLEIALCHYCDYQVPAPRECPQCRFAGIRYGGLGTQRLEAEVRARFPGVDTLRMDTDTMQTRGSHEKALALFRSGKVKILLGTQMIAKGLDFPNVTVVGVINADTALHLPDFRAAERTFQLVTQVAGRTGRGPKGGRVLVQTFNPDHPAIQAAIRHDFAAFANQELPIRKMLSYPPFSSMIRLLVRGPSEEAAAGFAEHLAGLVRTSLDALTVQARILGPAAAPFARLRGQYRFQIQIQGPDGAGLRAAVRRATAKFEPPPEIQWFADVDAVDML